MLLRSLRRPRALRAGRPGFPMRALLLGILLTMVMVLFGAGYTWMTLERSKEIATVELRLDRLSGVITHLDEVLTMSARMCAATGDAKWEERYRSFEPQLDAAIRETIAIAPQESVRRAAMRTDAANVRLVEIEHEAFDQVRAGHREQAERLLYSSEYEGQKAVYAGAMNETKRFIQQGVDAQVHRLSRLAMAGLVLTMAALIALTFGWARVLALVRHHDAERLLLFDHLEEAVRARDEFLSIASHELKTPLTTLKLQVERLAAGQPTGAHALEKKLVTVERQVDRLNGLIDALLDTSRITSGHMVLALEEGVDLSQIVSETVGRFKDELSRASCSLEVRGTERPILGRWDRLRLEQVVSNLLANSLKYGAGKPIEVEADANESIVRLAVSDHGIGIAPAKQAQIFERFERAVSHREYGGFGLGLWIVRQITTAMNGEVSVTSRPGEGSTFRVVLPRRVQDA
jgi:signal transduction histidine kinase